MNLPSKKHCLAAIAATVFTLGVDGAAVDFQRDIQPIFEQRCYECHGGKKQKSGLRLDQSASVFRGGDSGKPAIVRGDSSGSSILARVTSSEADEMMPPKGERLLPEQISKLRTWIDAGATWPKELSGDTTHWSYLKPVAPEKPVLKNKTWPRNGLDAFVLARLEQEKLPPSPEADRATLIRRVSLDLIGLPPNPREVADFLADKSPAAYEKVVDRLLGSPHYGERWARPWLDLARYADTQGYEKDNRRSMWPYRDWVIQALNRNISFKQFTIEQLAGDLLPNPTRDQRVATGFHRNTMTNTEGGTDDEEFRHEAIVDRVNTTMLVWMGTTMGCAQCHNHKYDPLTTKEYYQLFAIFNNTADSDKDDERPTLKLSSPDQERRLKELRQEISELDTKLKSVTPELTRAQAEWEQKLITSLAAEKVSETNSPASNESEPKPDQAAATKSAGKNSASPKLPEKIRTTLLTASDSRTEAQRKELLNYFRTNAHELKPIRDELAAARKSETDLEKSIPLTSIMEELAAGRETQIHLRGAYLSKGEKVLPGVPAAFSPIATNAPVNRLALANWLASDENPLTARVLVNRYWEQLFGIGIVETAEDFGKQGEPPANQALLDWLALEFMNHGWDMKAILKTMVMSATYRQTSHAAPELFRRDPFNRLLARGPRVRLDAELLRDQALSLAGLLSEKIGGPSVMPPQPDGLWQVVYSGDKWETSKGEDKHRRGLYTFWRRTLPHPAMTTFDAPSREFCVVRRTRSNTPLQALTILNDPEYIEAAEALARRGMNEGGKTSTQKIDFVVRLCLARAPRPAEAKRLLDLFEQERLRYEMDPKSAEAMAAKYLSKDERATDTASMAAWTVVANVLLNLDELITKG